MRRFLKFLAASLSVILLIALVGVALAWVHTDRALARTYVVDDPPLTMVRDATALTRGKHLFTTRGCAECHGPSGIGKLVFDGGPVLKLVAPNITGGGITAHMSADQIAAAIRHGVRPDGHPMVFMPTPDFQDLSDLDTAALVAYVQSLPVSANRPGSIEIRPLGRVLYALGRFPLLPAESVDHSPRSRQAPPAAATAAYGQYLAQGCVGCHGANLAGGHVPGTPPSFPDAQNLTPAGLHGWQLADFQHALRQGKRPDGSNINPFMPWRAFSSMSDQEIAALWSYLQTLPPVSRQR